MDRQVALTHKDEFFASKLNILRIADPSIPQTIKTDFLDSINDEVVSNIVKGDIIVNSELNPEDRKEKVFQFVAKETKQYIKSYLESQIPQLDLMNKKVLDKRLDIVE